MAKLYPDSFAEWTDAQRIIDIEAAQFPRVFQWQDEQRVKADRQKFLLTRFGYLRWFWSVFQWNAAWGKMAPGPDSERCVAFEPANDAFGIIREVILELHRTRHQKSGKTLLEHYRIMNNVHDSLEARPDAADKDEALHVLSTVMTKPRLQLQHPIIAPHGLWCDVELSVGPDMANMKKVMLTRDRWLHAGA